MLWPLVFIRFLLASTFRKDDAGPRSDVRPTGSGPLGMAAVPPGEDEEAGGLHGGGSSADVLHEDAGDAVADQLYCRMFGYTSQGVDCRQSQEWAEGCGCPVQRPQPCPPPTFKGNLRKVGWERDLDEKTAITYSFEKEWEGDAPRLHHLYEPAFKAESPCTELWNGLDDTRREQFMAAFRNEASKDPGALKKFHTKSSASPECYIDHKLLPLKRIWKGENTLSISDWIEKDFTPWEVKAANFYYDLGTMEHQVRTMLEDMDVPPTDDNPDGFPGERRIQVHVVASLSRQGPDNAPAANKALLSNFRLVQLYFSDYMFLRLGFPFGPKGARCKGIDQKPFKCDIFFDYSNNVINMATADKAYADRQGFVTGDDKHKFEGFVQWEDNHKFEIVGLRPSEVYRGATEINIPCIASADDDCSLPYRVGFEIRKSESFQSALDVARAISDALHTMTPAGHAQEGMRKKRNIGMVLTFAMAYRMKSGDSLRDFSTPDGFPICGVTFPKRDEHQSPEARVVVRFAAYLFTVAGHQATAVDFRRQEKLWNMLILLLCTDWTKLVGDVRTSVSRDDILSSFQTLRSLVGGEGVEAFVVEPGVREHLAKLHEDIATYAFELSEEF